MVCFHKEDIPLLVDTIERLINTADMEEYHNPDLGYVVKYPYFFEQIPDSLIDEFGGSQFRFWNVVEIKLSTFIVPDVSDQTVRQAMDSIGDSLHATQKRYGRDYFILTGPVCWEDGQVSGHIYHTKYVKRQKLWFVQELTYPEDCQKAVGRLIKQIDDWAVWDE